MTTSDQAPARRILVVSHFARQEAIDTSVNVIRRLDNAGIVAVLEPQTAAELDARAGVRLPSSVERLGVECAVDQCELVVVLGGDGTILRGVEVARPGDVPVLGVNMGHVGFLAESEKEALPDVVRGIIARNYDVEERLALQIEVEDAAGNLTREWALNDAALEKGNRERMLDVMIWIDGEPLSSFGCDGVLFSTPTGSTAYSFSAGGPVVWPQVEAILLVPVSAHALFAKPLVVGPDSELAVEVQPRDEGSAVLWLDGRRSIELPAGALVKATRSPQSVKLARLHQSPFTTRLVNKFQLPVIGWRGKAN
ncbi:NAD kinase [Gulosibacter molinativorax]|uniref:NAD kinase n=1 Tax=Gulosibacter molinativorax TaxID=256821 RepID=A0ABT7CB54_9MICO|nr:NAD kinase [Gulosibacter molinativorax]MDJ1372385.1 NAD kinase [Gulosibacter molinativorax]QUY61101.1 NAD kinase [Gulosibacter molinativorax]